MSKSLRTTIRILAAPNARVLLHARPSKEVRAQGMPGAGRNPWPACSKKKQAAVTTGTAKTSGIPCAMVLTLIARSPWGPGFLAPLRARSSSQRAWPQRREARTHTPSPSARAAFVLRALASTASRFACRDDRDTPLMPRRDGWTISVILYSVKQKYFSQLSLTGFLPPDPSGKSVGRCEMGRSAVCPRPVGAHAGN